MLLSLALPGPALPQGAPSRIGVRHRARRSAEHTDRLIVKFRSERGTRVSATGAPRMAALSARAGKALSHGRVMSGDAHVMHLPAKERMEDAEAIAARLRADPDVEYARPDRRVFAFIEPNDPHYTQVLAGDGGQWHYKNSSSEAGSLNLPGAWDVTTGASSVVVAVIDTGILTHADISASRKVPGYDFIADVATAGDGNGRDSDPSDPGDSVTANECGLGEPAEDSSWHGTHVAGTIGASSNNGLRVAGVNWVSKILPVRVLGKCGGWDSDILDAMRWSAGLAVSGVTTNANPAKVINMSLGGAGACDAAYQQAVNDVIAAGATLVVAAGNSNENVSNSVPANCTGVIAVAAVGRLGQRASYSNFGAGVTLAAPGGDGSHYIWSLGNFGTTSPTSDASMGLQGTSMATPHVAGAASLLLSIVPTLTPTQIKNILTGTARAFPAGTGSDCTTSICGAGIVDARAAVRSVGPTVSITAPSASALVSGSGVSLTVNTNSAVVGVQYKLDGSNLGSEATSSPFSATWNTTGSADGAHTLTAVARDSWGNTATSLGVAVTVDNTPPTVSNAAAAGITSSSATITWTTNEAADSQVEYGTTTGYGSSTVLDASMVTSHSAGITGLAANTLYHYRILSRDVAGRLTTTGDFTFTTLSLPTVSITSPSGGATVGGTSVSLAVSVNASVVGVQYKLDGSNLGSETTTSPFGATWNTTTASNASHSLTAVARDAQGNTATSAGVSVTVDNAAPIISAVAGAGVSNSSASVSWTTDHAADTQIDYGTTASYGSQTSLNLVLTTSHSQGITGLSVNTLYHYRVRSRDSGNRLSLSNDGTLSTFANAPAALTFIQQSSGSAIATWQENGNPSDTEYEFGLSSDNVAFTTLLPFGAVASPSLTMGLLAPNTTYYARVRARNRASLVTAYATKSLLIMPELIQQLDTRGGSLSFNRVALTVPPSAFSQPIQFTVQVPGAFPAATSLTGNLQATGAGTEITTDLGVQPARPLALTLDYTGSSFTNERRLLIARWDPVRGTWVPLYSTPDPVSHRVTALLDHLSIYQVMQQNPAASLDAASVTAFPNPVYTSRGQTMSFTGLPAGATIEFYTIKGDKVRAIESNASGMALWDGRTSGGSPAASGVYLALMKSGGQTRVMKVMVER
ncbi:MAG: S8 family serine peptidase [Proteobacteria bacterium]|nr:S8 family serine peptidase [Pseudomonadota bacterium]